MINGVETEGDDFGGALMPEQYYQLIRRHVSLNGETRLLYAVLEDAIRCYVATRKSRSRHQRVRFIEVQNWFGPRPPWAPPATGLFAFEPLCDALGIDPEAVRKCLDSMTLSDVPTRRHRRTSPSSLAAPRRRERRHRERGNGATARAAG